MCREAGVCLQGGQWWHQPSHQPWVLLILQVTEYIYSSTSLRFNVLVLQVFLCCVLLSYTPGNEGEETGGGTAGTNDRRGAVVIWHLMRQGKQKRETRDLQNKTGND